MIHRLSGMPLKVLIAGCIVVACVTFVTYAPTLKSGFRFVDDYTYLYWAGSMPLPQYLAYSWDPRVQVFNYRPLRRMLVLVEYNLFHAEASYYHLVQVLIHSANGLLVLGIVRRLSKRWRVAFLAAVLFAEFTIAGEAVFWITDESVLATFLSLAAVLFWVTYLQSKDRRNYLFAIGALVLAFLSKESSVAVPVALFLIDRMLIRDRASVVELAHRYSLIAVITFIYLAIEYTIQQQGVFVTVGGYSLGLHVILNYAAYLAMLASPWVPQVSNAGSALLAGVLVSFVIAVVKRNMVLVVLLIAFFFGIGPVVLSPQGAYGRYLYLAGIPLVILWALGFEVVLVRWNYRWLRVLAAVMVLSFVTLNAANAMSTIAQLSEAERQGRVPFQDIMRQHPSLANDTRLFLIEPPFNLATPELAGMFFLRYGANVSVGSTFEDGRVFTGGILRSERARLHDYAIAYVYYFDDANRPIEVPMDKEAITEVRPELPRDFEVPIRLEGYEITSSEVRRGQPLVLILYWRAIGQIDRDYTVFVHLVDSNGQLVAGEDSLPRNGKERTSVWWANQFTADAHVITVPQDAAVGSDYRLEVGLYYLPTMERLSILDDRGKLTTDRAVISPFKIVE